MGRLGDDAYDGFGLWGKEIAMAQHYEHVPMDASDRVGLGLIVLALISYGLYAADFFIGFAKMHG